MLRAIYPGSFDPVTFGHLDMIRRSGQIADELIVGVLNNKAKTPLFSVEERVRILEEVTKDLPNVKVMAFDGLLVEFAKQIGAKVIVRGLRAITDFEYELQMSQTNHKLEPEIETMFLTTSLEYSFLSSTTVKEVAAFGGDITQFVPELVVDKIERKDENQKESVTMSSRIEQIIEEIEEYIDGCPFKPLSTSKIIVNKDHIDELLRELRMKTPDENQALSEDYF